MSKSFAAAGFMQAEAYPDSLLPAMQETLAILADIDFAHREVRERIELWDGPEEAKDRLLAQADEEHRRAREPYVHLLESLQARMRATSGLAAALRPHAGPAAQLH